MNKADVPAYRIDYTRAAGIKIFKEILESGQRSFIEAEH